MPAQQDLRRLAADIPNPFDEEPPRIQAYTAQEIATLQSRLEKQLGPEYISSRKGPGGANVHYLGAEKIISLANDVFGFNGWSTTIRDTTIDYVDVEKDGRVSMGLSVIMRVTLKDGTFHEDVGYGMIANSPSKGAAFEKTKKEAATDAMKRALRNFGNVLGNCLYDKEYLKKVVKIKPPPSKWSEENLHRHPDVVPRQQARVEQQAMYNGESSTEKATSLPMTTTTMPMQAPPIRGLSEQSKRSSTDYDDEFGGNAFDDVDFTRSDEFIVGETTELSDEVVVVAKSEMAKPPMRPSAQQRSHSVPQSLQQQERPHPNTGQPMPRAPPAPPTNTRPVPQQNASAPLRPMQQTTNMLPPQQQGRGASSTPEQDRFAEQRQAALARQIAQGLTIPNANTNTCANTTDRQLEMNTGMSNGQPQVGQQIPETPPTLGFVRGRVADMIQSEGKVPANAAFNPHAESPSIRKTSGVNHATSKPVRREDLGQPIAPAPPQHNGIPNANGAGLRHNGLPPGQLPQPQIRSNNFVNPNQDPHRRIGAPVAAGLQSPGLRAGAYKPPGPAVGVKRGPPDAIPFSRPPLQDVSNVNKQQPVVNGVGEDAKRMRLSGGPESVIGNEQVAS